MRVSLGVSGLEDDSEAKVMVHEAAWLKSVFSVVGGVIEVVWLIEFVVEETLVVVNPLVMGRVVGVSVIVAPASEVICLVVGISVVT